MTASNRFWNRLAKHYSQQPIADEATYQRKLDVTRGYLKPDMELFEFGCGTGGTAIIHAPFVKHIRAIDFSEAMLSIARQRAEEAGVNNVSFELGAIEDLVVPPAQFDMVLGLSVLHLLEDSDAAIGKVFAMLKPGGLFVSSTTCIAETGRIIRFLAPLGKALTLLPHLNIMTKPELLDSLGSAGFVIEQEFQPGKGRAVFAVARKPAS
jgi:ubiquinone/menaquinone biosynthesis C-methylase UbiE